MKTTALGTCLALLIAAAATGQDAATHAAPGTLGFVASNAFSTAHGSFGAWRVVSAEVDPTRPSTGVVVVEVDVASIATGIARRDDHLRSADFFEVDKWPTARARVHDVRPDGQSERGNPRYRASFDVRIRDVEKTLEGSFELVSASPPAVEGELTLNRLDFGVGAPHSWWNPMSITEQVPVHFTATLKER